MSTLEDLDDLERHEKEEKKDEEKKKDGDAGKDGKKADGDAEMEDAEPEEEPLDEEILNSSTRDIIARRRLLENDMRIMKSEFQRLTHDKATMNEKIKDNLDKIENNRYAFFLGTAGAVGDSGGHYINNPQAIAIPCWQRRRDIRPGCYSRSRRRGRKHRPRCHPCGEVGGYQDVHETNHLPASHRSRRS